MGGIVLDYSIFQYDHQFVAVERIVVRGTPCLRFLPRGASGLLPTVLDYHGWHSSKEFLRFQATVLASFGYQVVVPDAPHHGEREAIDYDQPGALEQYFWPTILQSTEESTDLIECLCQHYGADPARLGVLGTSMGGFIASGVLSANPDVKCLVDINGSCAWIETEGIFREWEGNPPLSAESKAELARYDLLAQQERLRLRPLLLLHGGADTAVPIEGQRVFIDSVRPLYAAVPERLRLVEIANLNHHTTLNMISLAVDWLKRWL